MSITRDAWVESAKALFGDDPKLWRFVCPVCSTEQGYAEFAEHTDLENGTIDRVLAFSCVGRWARGGCEHVGLGLDLDKEKRAPGSRAIGCDYSGGGLFRLNPTIVEVGETAHSMFAFAPVTP